MTTNLSAPVASGPAAPNADDYTIDRAFLLQMAQIPFLAVLFVFLGWLSGLVWPHEVNFGDAKAWPGPVVLLCLGMILAAVIDGWAFKVPNWLTLSIVVSGWLLGGLNDLGWNAAGLGGGILDALVGTGLGFILLFPALFIGGMGQGDVKMQMGFGSWVGAIFGAFGANQGLSVIWWAFAVGVIIGGVFGLVIMVLRRQFSDNAHKFREIVTDLQVMVSQGPAKAAERANARRATWVRLPYGVPLCAGFLGYLAYLHFLAG
jgi:prepilin peptidase CpaA